VTRAKTRQDRLRKRPEYLRVQQGGVRTKGRYLTLFVLPNDLKVNRLGIIATRRFGGAVVRNRAKRLIREIFRLNAVDSIGVFLDIVVMPRTGFSEMPFDVLQSDYQTALDRHLRSR